VVDDEGSKTEQFCPVEIRAVVVQAAFAGATDKVNAEAAAAATARPAMENFLVIGGGVFSEIEWTEQQPQTMANSVYPNEGVMAQQPCCSDGL
jgi:hypothetical protein